VMEERSNGDGGKRKLLRERRRKRGNLGLESWERRLSFLEVEEILWLAARPWKGGVESQGKGGDPSNLSYCVLATGIRGKGLN